MIKINGQVINGGTNISSIIMNNDGIIINGKKMNFDDIADENQREIKIIIADCTVDHIDCGSVEIHGSKVGDIDCSNCKIEGNVDGDVDGSNVTVTGDVAGNVNGSMVKVGGNIGKKCNASMIQKM